MLGISTRSSCPGLGRFTSTPRTCAVVFRETPALRNSHKHPVRALGAFDGLDASAADDDGLPYIEHAERADHFEAERDVFLVGSRGCPAREQHPSSASVSGATSARPSTRKPLGFEKTHHAAQHAVIATRSQNFENRGNVGEKAEVGPDVA